MLYNNDIDFKLKLKPEGRAGFSLQRSKPTIHSAAPLKTPRAHAGIHCDTLHPGIASEDGLDHSSGRTQSPSMVFAATGLSGSAAGWSLLLDPARRCWLAVAANGLGAIHGRFIILETNYFAPFSLN